MVAKNYLEEKELRSLGQSVSGYLDFAEVENWYARRYPKLSAAQKANLRKLGRSDDYLELYGLR